jgi:hypothetical protein
LVQVAQQVAAEHHQALTTQPERYQLQVVAQALLGQVLK